MPLVPRNYNQVNNSFYPPFAGLPAPPPQRPAIGGYGVSSQQQMMFMASLMQLMTLLQQGWGAFGGGGYPQPQPQPEPYFPLGQVRPSPHPQPPIMGLPPLPRPQPEPYFPIGQIRPNPHPNPAILGLPPLPRSGGPFPHPPVMGLITPPHR